MDHMPFPVSMSKLRRPDGRGDVREEPILALGCLCGWFMLNETIIYQAIQQYKAHIPVVQTRPEPEDPGRTTVSFGSGSR